MKRFIFVCIILIWAQTLSAQIFNPDPDQNFRITPLVGPAYTPELGFMLAGGIMMSMSMDPDNPDLRRSSFPVNLGFSSTGAKFANSKISSFWLDDLLRVYANLYFKDMPDHYFGVGYDTNSRLEKGSKTSYHRRWWEIRPEILFRMIPNFYGGLHWDLNSTTISEKSLFVSTDPTILRYGDSNLNHGLGIILQFDSRDIPVNAWEGIFMDARSTFYSGVIGSQNDYQVFELDYRQYERIIRKGSTLAWQIKGRISTGNVPYNELSQLGSPFDLRGYFWGQYRDKNMAFGLAEYRFIFKKKDGDLGPHGVNFWGGLGTIGNERSGPSPMLWNVGFGYRLEVQPRMNLRIDFGFGKDSFGFYFNFNEAF